MPKRPFYATPPPRHQRGAPPKAPKGGNREVPLIAGRLSVHRDGFGFVIPDQPIEGIAGDLFLPPEAAAKAMHGDRVGARIVRLGRLFQRAVEVLGTEADAREWFQAAQPALGGPDIPDPRGTRGG